MSELNKEQAEKIRIVISPIITVSPTFEVNFDISTVVKLMGNLIEIIKRIANREAK